MDEIEFDRFAAEYRAIHAPNIRITGEGPEYFAEYKVRDAAAEYRARRGDHEALNVLDFGAGIGTSVPFFRTHLPRSNITCLDVSEKCLAVGEARFGEDADFVRFDGTTLPSFDRRMHIAFAACVFHHIPHGKHVELLRQLRQALAPGGLVFVFEHNPLNPVTVRAVNSCPFDENAKLIFAWAMRRRLQDAGFRDVRVRYRIFFPHALSLLRPLERWMTWLPLGAQYYVTASP